MTDHPDVTAETLRDALLAYDRVYFFARGDLVQQKSGLAKYGWSAPMIFVRYLDPARLGFVEDGSDGEVADCVVGVRGAEGEMLFMTAVASRLEPWKYE